MPTACLVLPINPNQSIQILTIISILSLYPITIEMNIYFSTHVGMYYMTQTDMFFFFNFVEYARISLLFEYKNTPFASTRLSFAWITNIIRSNLNWRTQNFAMILKYTIEFRQKRLWYFKSHIECILHYAGTHLFKTFIRQLKTKRLHKMRLLFVPNKF